MCKMEHPLLYWLPCPPKKLGGLYPTLTVVCFISFFLLSTETECINYVVVGITVRGIRGGLLCDLGAFTGNPSQNVICNMFIYVFRNFRSLCYREL